MITEIIQNNFLITKKINLKLTKIGEKIIGLTKINFDLVWMLIEN